MIIEQIAAMAQSDESETLEFKRTTGTRREAARTLCAFPIQRSEQVLFRMTQAGVAVGQQVNEHTTIEESSAGTTSDA